LGVFCNILSGSTEQSNVILGYDIIPKLVKLLSYDNSKIVNQAFWAVGNIAGNSAENRDLLLDCGVMDIILKRANYFKGNHLEILSWNLSNFVRLEDFPCVHLGICFRILKRLFTSNNSEVLKYACWAVVYISRGNDGIQIINDGTIMPMILNVIKNNGEMSPLFLCLTFSVLENIKNMTEQNFLDRVNIATGKFSL
jgi:hypothetical protein